MTLDEARDTLADLVHFIKDAARGGFTDKDMQAIDIALWLMERFPLAESVQRASTVPDSALDRQRALHDWEQANPPPFSRADPCPHNPKCMSFEKCCR